MIIELIGYNEDLLSLEDLQVFVPASLEGQALNYGQGEGQFQIGETVWGVYVNERDFYYLQYEEGNLGSIEFINLLQIVLIHLSENLTDKVKVIGVHEGKDDV